MCQEDALGARSYTADTATHASLFLTHISDSDDSSIYTA